MTVAGGSPSTVAPIRPTSSFGVFRHRQFSWFFIAASISNGASWMQTIAVPALVFDLTGQASWLGYVSVAGLVPGVVLTPYAGVLADRVSRRLVLICTQTLQMASTFAMWGLYVGHSLTPWRVLALSLVAGVGTGLQISAWQSFVPSLVPVGDILHAVKLNSMQFTLARAIGPATAGLVVHTWGVGAAILFNAVTYPLVIAVLLICRPRQLPRKVAPEPVLTALAGGARYVWVNKPLRLGVILAFATGTCCQSLQHVASAIAKRMYGHPSVDNAGLLTALGIGAVTTAAVSAAFGDRFRRSQQLTFGLAVYTLSTAVIASTSSYRVGLIAYGASGIAHLTTAVALNTLMQGTVAEEMRGRVVSYHLLGILGGIPLGAFVLGRLGDAIGMRQAVAIDAAVIAGLSALLVASGWLRLTDTPGPDG